MKLLKDMVKALCCSALLGAVWFALAYTCAGSLSVQVRYISMAVVLVVVSLSVQLVFHLNICSLKWMNLILLVMAFGFFMLLIEHRDTMFETLSSARINFFLKPS
jgi:hypothetical protein